MIKEAFRGFDYSDDPALKIIEVRPLFISTKEIAKKVNFNESIEYTSQLAMYVQEYSTDHINAEPHTIVKFSIPDIYNTIYIIHYYTFTSKHLKNAHCTLHIIIN